MKALATLLLAFAFATAAAAQATYLLPIEVLGADAATRTVTLTLSRAPADGRLAVRAHRLAYRDASTAPERGAKGSVRVNGGAWVPLSNATPGIAFAGQSAEMGGLNGAYHTVDFTVPVTGLTAGANEVAFRFNGSDGHTNGYRVLYLGAEDANGARLDDPSAAVADDPATWGAPTAGAEAVARGRDLWFNKTLRESVISAKPIRATCSDCHSKGGEDLKYFNYSNRSITERSRFHGLTEAEGQAVASYIRSLDYPAPAQARPYNPPYQPGPDWTPRRWWRGARARASRTPSTRTPTCCRTSSPGAQTRPA